MMNYILFDGPSRNDLLPFTFTRPVADIRVGILSIRQKWEKMLGAVTTTKTEAYLSEIWPLQIAERNIFINSSFIPTPELIEQIKALKENESLVHGDDTVAYFQNSDNVTSQADSKKINIENDLLKISYPWDIFSKNAEAIKLDFELLTSDRTSQEIHESNYVKASENIFIEEGAVVENCSLNASSGPIYIGKDALVMEGSLIRGPLAVGDHAVIKMGAKIYGATTIGPYCKVGGEINNSVLFANTSKGHDGYLGNSVLGEWCNIGADSNNSNLKNNYAEVRVWNYNTERFARTGLQFCGLIMGDHSKCAINTMFNTGTVVGVSANIFGSGFPRNFIPSFSWGGSAGTSTYKLEKVFETAGLVMQRRDRELTAEERNILTHVFDLTSKWRKG